MVTNQSRNEIMIKIKARIGVNIWNALEQISKCFLHLLLATFVFIEILMYLLYVEMYSKTEITTSYHEKEQLLVD